MTITDLGITCWKGQGTRIAVGSLTLTPKQFTARYNVQFVELPHDLGICAVAVVGLADRMFLLEAFPEWENTNFVQISCPSSELDPVAAIDSLLHVLDLDEAEISSRRIAWELEPNIVHNIIETIEMPGSGPMVAIDTATARETHKSYQVQVIKPDGDVVPCFASKEPLLSLAPAPADCERYTLKGIQKGQIPTGSRLQFLDRDVDSRAMWASH